MFRNGCLPIVVLSGLALLVPVRSQAQEKQGPKLPEGTKVERDLRYGLHEERNVLDLYVPKSDKPLPLIIWVHGGGWQNGSKAGGGPALAFLTKGYAVASINYRLCQHAVYPAQIEDCKAAARFLRANAGKYHFDPDHIGVWGASAGGHLVALLGTTGNVKEFDAGDNLKVSSRVQAVVDFFGPTDLTKMGGSHDNPNSPEAKLLGGPVQENKAKAAKANPITYVTKEAAPFLILHGDKNQTVPYSQSELLAEALKKAGVEVTLHKVEGAGHGGKQFAEPENTKLIEEFFNRHLKAKK